MGLLLENRKKWGISKLLIPLIICLLPNNILKNEYNKITNMNSEQIRISSFFTAETRFVL